MVEQVFICMCFAIGLSVAEYCEASIRVPAAV